jgi:hypothetical protein
MPRLVLTAGVFFFISNRGYTILFIHENIYRSVIRIR